MAKNVEPVAVPPGVTKIVFDRDVIVDWFDEQNWTSYTTGRTHRVPHDAAKWKPSVLLEPDEKAKLEALDVMLVMEDMYVPPAPAPGEPEDTGTQQLSSLSPPELENPVELKIERGKTYDLDPSKDYKLVAPKVITGPVHIRGGRNVVWIGGHIRIPEPDWSTKPAATKRRALVISDKDGVNGSPRVVHIEGLLIDGPGLSEGINTNCPTAGVQLVKIRVGHPNEPVHHMGEDERDGKNGWHTNHPDIVQTWGSQRFLKIDGLTGFSNYQGLFFREDRAGGDPVLGPIDLKHVDVHAVSVEGLDGRDWAGHRMITCYEGFTGPLTTDPETVRVQHHPDGGWVDGKYYRDETPGTATFFDAFGDKPAGHGTGENGRPEATIFNGAKVQAWLRGDEYYVKTNQVGVDYTPGGYETDTAAPLFSGALGGQEMALNKYAVQQADGSIAQVGSEQARISIQAEPLPLPPGAEKVLLRLTSTNPKDELVIDWFSGPSTWLSYTNGPANVVPSRATHWKPSVIVRDGSTRLVNLDATITTKGITPGTDTFTVFHDWNEDEEGWAPGAFHNEQLRLEVPAGGAITSLGPEENPR